MKCIKCSYTSFDFNQTCPKCGKDLSAQAEKLDLPAFKPAPPYLLTTLTGETAGAEHSLGNEQSESLSFLENQNEEMFMLDKNMIDSSEIHEESSQDNGDDELMVALDELSFEYEPALEEGSETPEFSQSDDLFMPEISQEEIASSTDSVLFDEHITEEAPHFAPMDKADQPSSIFDQIEESGEIESMESHLELDLSDIDKAEDQSEKVDELLISLDELSFEQESDAPNDSLEREHVDEDVLSVSELLDFGEENFQDQTGPVVGTSQEDKSVSMDFKEESLAEFEIPKRSDISDQSENAEGYIKLDLSDIDQSEDRFEDNDTLLMSFEEGGSKKTMLPEDNEISLVPDMLNSEETAASNKDGKTKTEPKKDYIGSSVRRMSAGII